MAIGLTKKQLAEAAGYTYRHIHEIDKRMPEDEKLFVPIMGSDKYDLSIFVQRWVDYKISEKGEKSEKMDSIAMRRENAKADKLEFELERMRGVYVKLSDVRIAWQGVAGVVRSRFVNLPKKLAPSLVMIGDPDIIEEAIWREVRDALNMIAQTPLPGEADEMSEDVDEDEEVDE